ncbi:MAG: hypothetical protein V4509_02685 [Patescibacteria group bacterium]
MKKITTDILKQKMLTESDIKLLCRRANDSTTKDEVLNALRDIDDISFDITPDQNAKGIAWLRNQYKTPRGVERKNNPFGYREEDVINYFTHFTFDGLYDAGNYQMSYFVPIYTAHGEMLSGEGEGKQVDISFQYVLSGGKINIIG